MNLINVLQIFFVVFPKLTLCFVGRGERNRVGGGVGMGEGGEVRSIFHGG